jgi:hypothetical protein
MASSAPSRVHLLADRTAKVWSRDPGRSAGPSAGRFNVALPSFPSPLAPSHPRKSSPFTNHKSRTTGGLIKGMMYFFRSTNLRLAAKKARLAPENAPFKLL